MKRVDVRDIDLDHLEELDNDEFFTKKKELLSRINSKKIEMIITVKDQALEKVDLIKL